MSPMIKLFWGRGLTVDINWRRAHCKSRYSRLSCRTRARGAGGRRTSALILRSKHRKLLNRGLTVVERRRESSSWVGSLDLLLSNANLAHSTTLRMEEKCLSISRCRKKPWMHKAILLTLSPVRHLTSHTIWTPSSKTKTLIMKWRRPTKERTIKSLCGDSSVKFRSLTL